MPRRLPAMLPPRAANPQLISVITAVGTPARAEHLAAARESIEHQQLPGGWAIEWMLEIDGPDIARDVVDLLASWAETDHTWIDVGRSPWRGGAGVARNMALARSAGAVIQVLDGDDLLLPGALARGLRVLTHHPDVAWVAHKTLDLLPDGSMRGWHDDPDEGAIERGEALEHWRTHNGIPPVVAGSMAMRREDVLRAGGWMAITTGEDTGLLMALSATTRGWFISTPGYAYRKWHDQTTEQAGHIYDRGARLRLIAERADMLAAAYERKLDGPRIA